MPVFFPREEASKSLLFQNFCIATLQGTYVVVNETPSRKSRRTLPRSVNCKEAMNLVDLTSPPCRTRSRTAYLCTFLWIILSPHHGSVHQQKNDTYFLLRYSIIDHSIEVPKNLVCTYTQYSWQQIFPLPPVRKQKSVYEFQASFLKWRPSTALPSPICTKTLEQTRKLFLASACEQVILARDQRLEEHIILLNKGITLPTYINSLSISTKWHIFTTSICQRQEVKKRPPILKWREDFLVKLFQRLSICNESLKKFL